MSFFERYEKLCMDNGYEPGSQAAAEAIGTNRGTISAWRTTGSPPKTKYLVAIADVYHVSVDYLLERTDDPIDYTNPDLLAELSGAALDELGGDVKKALAKDRATAEDVRREKERAAYPVVSLYESLDETDRIKVEAYMQGLLSQDKYAKRKVAL